MKKSILMFLLSVLFLGLVGCAGEATTVESTTVTPTTDSTTTEVVTYGSYLTIRLGEQTFQLGFNDTELSVFELIENSDIHLAYDSTDFGPMVTGIGDLEQDDFHWIGFTKNGEMAMSGLDTIAYTDGDVFEFTENLVSWETMINAELLAVNDDHLVFENSHQSFIVYLTDLPETTVIDDLVVGFIYQLTGLVDEATDETNNVFDPSVIDLDAIVDFTELYNLEEGDVFILEFTVTYTEDSMAFGTEIFAEDVNGLSSTEISSEMLVESETDYIFYTIPETYELVDGETYIGRFIYQVNEPSTIPQMTLYEENINGDDLTDVIVQP